MVLGALTFWVSIRGMSAAVLLLAAALSVFGAIASGGNVFSRAAFAITPLWVLAAASWSGALLAAMLGVLLVLILRFLPAKKFQQFGWSAAVFIVSANMFVFSSQLMTRPYVVFILAAASLAVIVGAHVTSFRNAPQRPWPMILVALVMIMEILFVLRMLPYGYLSLAAIATIWYSVLIALYGMQLDSSLNKKKVGQEVLIAAVLTLLIAASSGMSPR